MPTDLDPRLEDAARRQLARLLDAIDVGPVPEAVPRTHAPAEVVRLGTLPAGTPHRPGTRRRAVVAVAAAVAFLLGVGVALALRSAGGDGPGPGPSDGGNGDGPASVDPGTETQPDPGSDVTIEVPHLVPGGLPDGVEPLFSGELPMDPGRLWAGSADVTVYGRSGAPDPFAGGDLAVIMLDDATFSPGGTEITVRGGPGRSGESSEDDNLHIATGTDRAFRWVSWSVTSTVEVTLASRSLTVEELRALAEGAEIDTATSTVVLPAGPAGLDAVGALDGLTFGGPVLVPGSALGWHDVYGWAAAPTPGVPAPGAPALQVSTFAGTGEELLAARWMVDATPAPGREGSWLSVPADDDTASRVTLLWEPSPGVIGVVHGSAELTYLVNELEPVG